MGTSIELRVAKVSLSYAKNNMGEDYGFLFQGGDIYRRKTDAIDYEFYEESTEEEKKEIAIAEELFVRKLFSVVPRLDMLGFTLDSARSEYKAIVEYAEELNEYMEEDELKKEYLSFEEFCALACRYSLDDLNDDYVDYRSEDRDIVSLGRFASELEVFDRIPIGNGSGIYWSEASFFSERVCILSAESMLQIFALNDANAESEVKWEFGPIVYAGWVQRECFQPGALKKQKVLIATEGKSDARIIQRSLEVMRPDVADFFNFIDLNEPHHFWGASNLAKLADGLLRIDVLNKILFVFDNDAEGVEAFRKLEKLKLPPNMRAMLLPDLEQFKKFSTFGPEGVYFSDINGRAASIECYLDLRLIEYPEPQVIWSNFKKDIGSWHGALQFKESYSKYFYDQSNDSLLAESYDTSKLAKLVDTIIAQSKEVIAVI